MLKLSRILIITALAALVATQVMGQGRSRRANQRSAGQCAETVYYGAAQRVGNGTARTLARLDTLGRPTAIAITMTEAALNGLPAHDTEFVLAMPPEATRTTPFKHVVLNWNVHGHRPAALYGAPHFDFHFYMITPAQRAAITGAPAESARGLLTPQPQFRPAGFAADTQVEPRMGVHWVSTSAPELHGQPFTETFIYGFYGGRMTFIEPMITRAYLATHPNVVHTVAVPAAYPTRGYYPTSYSVRYDPDRHTYTVALESFLLRPAPTGATATQPA